jgi:hypothetical protein
MPRTTSASATMLFVFILNLHFIAWAPGCSTRSPATGEEVDQDHNQRDHQQDMDYPSQRVTGYETEQPQKDQDYRYCEQHIFYLSLF